MSGDDSKQLTALASCSEEEAAAPPTDTPTANSRLEELLGYGRFQFLQVWIFASLFSFIGAMNMYQLLFSVTRKPTRCALPNHIEEQLDSSALWNHTSLLGECSMAQLSTADPACIAGGLPSFQDYVDRGCFNTSNMVPCEFGYVHDSASNGYFFSLSAQNDWVCDKAELGSDLLMAENVGRLVNMLVFMQLSDKLGRRAVLHVTNLTYMLSRFLILVLYDHYVPLLIVVALGSGTFPIGIRVAYILVAEYTNEKGRLQLYTSGWIFWVAGVAALPLAAYLCQDWYTYGIVTTAINVAIIPFWWFSPESPRLLLTKNRVPEAEGIIRDIYKLNRTPVPDSLNSELKSIASAIGQESKSGAVQLFTSSKMAIITLIFCITWTVNDFLYVGGQMNVENLAGNQFVNFALVGLTELPSVFIGEFLMNRIGRRWSHCLCMTLTTVCFAAIVPLAGDIGPSWAVTTLALSAKTLGNVAWFINYVQNVELFPTCVRTSGMNFCAAVSTVICTAAPYLVLLGGSNERLMYGVFALVGCVGVVATSFVHETFKHDFPECLADIERRTRHPYLSWRVWEAPEGKAKAKEAKCDT